MNFIVDASFGHDQITPDNLRRIGATGAILYAGCQDPAKNVTEPEFQALVNAGFLVALVIENGTQDMLAGYATGRQYGAAILSAARSFGYDYRNCVLYTAADWDVTSVQRTQVDQFMQGFGSVVPVPGIYGDRDVLDYCGANGHARGFWQTNADSWSAGIISGYAQLHQRFNDPRAGGLPVDVNDILKQPLLFMGEVDMTPEQEQRLIDVQGKVDQMFPAVVNSILPAVARLDTQRAGMAQMINAAVLSAVQAAMPAASETDAQAIAGAVLSQLGMKLATSGS